MTAHASLSWTGVKLLADEHRGVRKRNLICTHCKVATCIHGNLVLVDEQQYMGRRDGVQGKPGQRALVTLVANCYLSLPSLAINLSTSRDEICSTCERFPSVRWFLNKLDASVFCSWVLMKMSSFLYSECMCEQRASDTNKTEFMHNW